MKRAPWFLLTGLVIGLGLGLLCAWVLCPVNYTQTAPASLRADFKDTYRSLIARAYAYDGNLPRAKARLALLGDPNPADTLAAQAQQALAAGRPMAEVRALGALAAALGEAPTPVQTSVSVSQASPTATPRPQATATPTPVVAQSGTTATPAPTPVGFPTLPPTPTPLPTRTPQPAPTAGAPFLLRSQEPYCNPDDGPLLRIFMRDADDQPVPGMAIYIHWLGGDEEIFTGLKPDIDPGYADFLMTPDVVYQVRPAYGTTVTDLQARECQADDGSRYWGGWTLIFAQP